MLRHADGFDHYPIAKLGEKWDTSQAAPVYSPAISSSGRTGSCLQLISSYRVASYIFKAFETRATWIAGGAFNFALGHEVGPIAFMDGTTLQCGIVVNSSNHVAIYYNGSAVATSTLTLNPGWNYFEFKVTFNDTSSTASVSVNNAVWASYTGQLCKSGNSYADKVCFGDWYISSDVPGNIFVDDVYICDSQDTVNNDVLGDICVVPMRPTAQGYYSAFSAYGNSNHYACVNEASSDSDTTYLSSNSYGSRDSFIYNGPVDLLNVKGIQAVIDARKVGAGARAVAPFFRISGTNYDGTAGQNLSTSYSMTTEMYNRNPATSSSWTAGDLSSLEAGIRIAT